jgi:hypothetical protein
MKIKLFFDPETFRHVRTEYRIRTKYDMTGISNVTGGSGPASRDQNAVGGRPMDRDPKATIQESQPDSIYTLIEKFGNFASIGGLMLPRDYVIEYSQEGHIAVFLAKWAVMVEYWKPNSSVNPEFFMAQK